MSVKDSNTAIKYFNLIVRDGRITVCNHRLDPDDDNFYVDLAFQTAKDGKYEYPIFAPRVALNDWYNIGEALQIMHEHHPMKHWLSDIEFSLRMNTLNKTNIAHIQIGDAYQKWVKIPYKLGVALLESDFVKQTWSVREAFMTNFNYLDHFHLVVIKPEGE